MKTIKKKLREVAGFILRFLGISFLIRALFCKNKVTIVFYHNPKPEILKKHIEYLLRHYKFMPLNKLVDAISKKDWTGVPAKSLVITIDDGYMGNYKLLDIFKAYNLYPTIYLCSHIVNTNRRFWFKAGFHNIKKLKKLASKPRLKALKDEIGYDPQKEYPIRQALNLEELREMKPYVDFQAHSKLHPILTACLDEECKEEIEGSKEYLEKLLQKKIEYYSYPNGDYNKREIEYVKSCGYKSARTLDIGWNDVNSCLYRLKAMGVDDDASINILCAQVSGFFGYLRYLRYGSFKGKHPPHI